MGEVVCEICGSGSRPHLIANCTQCDAYEHCYCMLVVDFEIPHEWQCYECREKANGGPKHSQGGQTVLQRPLHCFGLTKEMETPKPDLSPSNVVHQVSPKTSKKFGSTKVKFISCEEAVLLSRERPPHFRSNFAMRQSQVHPTSPPNVKQTSNMKCKSPSRSDMQGQALKRCAAARLDQAEDRPNIAMRQGHVCPASPPNVKHLYNAKCISTRSNMQVHALRRSAAASHGQAKLKDINMNWDARSGSSMPRIHRCSTDETVGGEVDSQIEDKTRENKIVNADNGKINSQSQDKPREKGTLCASDYDTGCKSQMESLNHNTVLLVTINSSAEYSRRPPPFICWTGCFLVFDAGTKHNLGEFQAQFPSRVSPKVYDIVKKMPANLQLELLPRMSDWPKFFETNRPFHEDIGLFFFSNEHEGHEKKHALFLEACNNYVLRAYIDGIKLLIYSSEVLPPDSQWIDGESYLWGMFVRSKGKCGPRPSGSTTT